MSIDNNGMLMVGLKDKDIPYDTLPNFKDSDYLEEWVYANLDKVSIPSGVEFRDVSTGYLINGLAGFVVADSGSYQYKEVENIEDKIKATVSAFESIFGVKPKVFILNYQY